MPETILNRFVVLETCERAGSRLRLRFVPDIMELDYTDPVMQLEIELTAGLDDADAKISQLQEGLVDGIEVNQSTLSIWVEHFDEPVILVGTITWQYEDYATSDYIEEIKRRDEERERNHRESLRLYQKIGQAVRFIDRTIDHIERRQDLTQAMDDRYAKQIQLLRGVRRHLAEDE